MNQNETQLRFSRVSKQQSVHRDYPLRNCSKKEDFIYDFDDTNHESYTEKPTLKLYRSWSSDHQLNDSASEVSFPELDGKEAPQKHEYANVTNIEKQQSCEDTDLKYPPIPKVILKRSYSNVSSETPLPVNPNPSLGKRRQGKDTIFNKDGIEKYHGSNQNGKGNFKRKRGRPRKLPFINSSSRPSVNRQCSKAFACECEKNDSNCNLFSSQSNKLQASSDAKQILQDQVQLKRSLSTDSAKSIHDKLVDNENRKEKPETAVAENSVASNLGPTDDGEINSVSDKPGCVSCSIQGNLDDLTVETAFKANQTINIDRCLKWKYELSNSEWLDCSNAFKLLKRKYPVLKILFKKYPVIVLEQLSSTKSSTLQRSFSCMASRFPSSDVNDNKDNLVDPRVVSLSKTLMSNAKGKLGIDKVFSKNKIKPFKESKSVVSHTMAKSKHDLSFKLRLKEACKPKPKIMEKSKCRVEKEKACSNYKPADDKEKNDLMSERQRTIKSDVNKVEIQCVSENLNLRNPENKTDKNFNTREDLYENLNRSTQVYPNVSQQSESVPGSPGPPHLEREYMRSFDEGYSDTEMEILKMNDFEIEICRDEDNEMPEVLDMRTGIRDSVSQSDAQNGLQSSLHKVSGGKLEINIDTNCGPIINSSHSPSSIVIQNVCSLNQVYNKSDELVLNENDIFSNEKILEMLEGDIFDTRVTDSVPLDLVKLAKQPETMDTSDSDETFIYSDASDDVPEFDSKAQEHRANRDSSVMSPRLKAMKSTKNKIPFSGGGLSSSNDCTDTTDRNDKIDNLSSVCKQDTLTVASSQRRDEHALNFYKVNLTEEMLSSENAQPTQTLNEKGLSDGKKTKRQRAKSAAQYPLTLDFKRKTKEKNKNPISNHDNLDQSDIGALKVDENALQSDTGSKEDETEESDSCGLVISEVEIEMPASETDASVKDAKTVKTGKPPSFDRNIGKNKEMKQFMSKEKERRKSQTRESKHPKVNRMRGNSNEDNDDLPQILPPKRRQRVQKSNSVEESSDEGKAVAMERIMADFPKHNWLFNKYNNMNSEEKVDSPINKQSQESKSCSFVATMTSCVTSSDAAKTPPVTGNDVLAGNKTTNRQQTGRTITSSSEENDSQTSNYKFASSSVHKTCNESKSLELKGEVNSALSESKDSHVIPRSLEEHAWIPVKDHDPTLASLTLSHSPQPLVPFEEDSDDKSVTNRDSFQMNNTHSLNVSFSDQDNVRESAESTDLVSNDALSSKDVSEPSVTTQNDLPNLHNKSNISKSSVDTALTSQLNSDKGKVSSSVQGIPFTSSEKTVISRPYIKKTVPKCGVSAFRLGTLRPETIQAIKQGNPALFKTSFSLLSQQEQLNVNDKRVDCIKTTAETKPIEGNSSVILGEKATKTDEKAVVETQNVVMEDVNSKKDLSQNCDNSRVYMNDKVESHKNSLEGLHYPLNMTKKTSGFEITGIGKEKLREIERPEKETWTAEAPNDIDAVEPNSYESEEMALPLDLCINRSVTENSFANYRKHHPPPVQMVHPQIQKPAVSEPIIQNTETVLTDEHIIDDEIKDDSDSNSPLNETDETSSQILNASKDNQNSLTTDVQSTDALSDVPDIQQKVEEMQKTVSCSTLISANGLTEAQVIAKSSTNVASVSDHAQENSGYVQTVPVVTQYRPVLVHPVQQMNTGPQTVTVPAHVIQPILPLHTNTGTTILPPPPLISNSHFNGNIIHQSQIITNSHQVQPVRQTQPINSVGQQATYQNIQLVIPAGPYFVPMQSPSNDPPIIQQFGNTVPPLVTNSNPGRRAMKKILPKPNEVPSKRRKKTPEDKGSQDIVTSLAENAQMDGLNSIINPSSNITTSLSPETFSDNHEKNISDDSEVSQTKSESVVSEVDSKRDSDDCFSEENETMKIEESSDELLEEDEELKMQMEEYRKLKEERKQKEREEMEMRMKIAEKMKLAKSRKQKVNIKPEKTSEKKCGEKLELKSEQTAILLTENAKFIKVEEEMEALAQSLPSDTNNDRENNKDLVSDGNESIEVIAEWNVPTSDLTNMPSNKLHDNLANESVSDNSLDEDKCLNVPISLSSEHDAVNTGLDLRVEQDSALITTNRSISENLVDKLLCSSSVNSLSEAGRTFTSSVAVSHISEASKEETQMRQKIMITKDGDGTGTTRGEDFNISEINSHVSVPQDKRNTKTPLEHSKINLSSPFVSMQANPICTITEPLSKSIVTSNNILTYYETEQRPYSPPILTPRPIQVQQKRTIFFEEEMSVEKDKTEEEKMDTAELQHEIIKSVSNVTLMKDELELAEESMNKSLRESDSMNKDSAIPSDLHIKDTSDESRIISISADSSISVTNKMIAPCSPKVSGTDSTVTNVISTDHSPPTTSTIDVEMDLSKQLMPEVDSSLSVSVSCYVSKATAINFSSDLPNSKHNNILSPSITDSSTVSRDNNSLCTTSSSSGKVIMSVSESSPPKGNEIGLNYSVITTTAPVSSSAMLLAGPDLIDLTSRADISVTSVSDPCAVVLDYSTKTSSVHTDQIKTGSLPESLTHYRSPNITRKLPSDESSHIYVSTSSTPVTVAYSSFTKLTSTTQRKVASNGKLGAFCEIPFAHTKPKPEKLPKGAKPLPAHNNNQVVSLKTLIKKLNRTIVAIPSQIIQSCPYQKKSLQYNWSPSPRDTYKTRLARRESPVPPPAHGQKPFGIAGKLIIPAGRFSRKRASTEFREMPFGTSGTDFKSSHNRQGSVSPTSSSAVYKKTENQSPVITILPPIRAHIHLDGNADTVTVTNVQKPSTFLGYPKLPVTSINSCIEDVVDLTIDEPVNEGDKDMFNRAVHLDDAEKQIQKELSKAVAKRQKLDSNDDDVISLDSNIAEVRPNSNVEQNNRYTMDTEEDIMKKHRKKGRPSSQSFQMNHPVTPSGISYQPMPYGHKSGVHPPKLVQNCRPVLQDQHLRLNSNVRGPSSVRTVLQASHEDVQAQIQVSNRRQTLVDNTVPPLIRLRETRVAQAYASQNQPPQLTDRQTVAVASETGYQTGGYSRQSHGLRPQQQVPPALVHQYLVPASQGLRSPLSPDQRIMGPGSTHQPAQRVPTGQSYNGQPQGIGLSPKQRYPPPYPQRISSGPVQAREVRYSPGGQISPSGQSPRGQLPSPDFQGYNSQGQVLQPFSQGHIAPDPDTRRMMPSPQSYPYKGRLPSPNVQLRHSGSHHSREYLHSPVQGQSQSQGQNSRRYVVLPADQGPGPPLEQEPCLRSVNAQNMERFIQSNRGQGQIQLSPQQRLPPPAHSSLENGSQQWAHGRPSPQGQRIIGSQYTSLHDRITQVSPPPPPYPVQLSDNAMIHPYEKAYSSHPGRSTGAYSSVNAQVQPRIPEYKNFLIGFDEYF